MDTGMDSVLQSFWNAIDHSGRNYNREKIEAAYKYANELHKGQKRQSGEPYITHPVAVAEIVAGLGLDTDSICAALLHDTVEDCADKTSLAVITEKFGQSVAMLVDGLTKIKQIDVEDKEEANIENIRKMLLAMSKDIRVIFIKLCDRLHNMRTLAAKKEDRRRAIALETMYIYAPLAHRLGINSIKQELENLSLSYLDPIGYNEVKSRIEERYGQSRDLLDEAKASIDKRLRENGIHFELTGRIKSIYSLYNKMYNHNKSFDQIYDFYALRIIVDTELECYTALGIIHEMFRSIPGRFKDYISNPKPNMYRSLHTSVMSSSGIPFEVQIRTFEMHRVAEFGIAAHWKYKSGETSSESIDSKLQWVSRLFEIEDDTQDPDEFMDAFKIDIFRDEVFVFTPKGDVIVLPQGATMIDFAYAIHSGVGNKMVGAKVNGMIVPIDREPQTGDIIEVLTSSASKGPSRDWLKIAKSSQAKSRINQWFRQQNKTDNIVKGKEMLTNYAKLKGKNLGIYTKPMYEEAVMRKYGFRDWDSVLAAIGHGGLKEGQVLNKLIETYEKQHKKEITDEQVLEAASGEKVLPVGKSKGGIVVRGIHDVAVRFSKCCNPIPGDEIVGFVTRGRGVTIHRTDCVNVLNLPESERARLIDAEWQAEDNGGSLYTVEISVYANNRTGLLVDISKIFTERKIDLAAMNVRTSKQGTASIDVTFDVHNNEELNSIIEKVRQVESVIDIQRSRG